ncbi:ABC-2 family transporter protein [Paenibacillus albidus]|uniref:ABC-2 family transporter protein n=1 Tax=Paenibacillus albidus TaxID=2041023 RepID=UPI0016658CB0|nr:ABC-2 family transporter protein [Paenibacillus albidus]
MFFTNFVFISNYVRTGELDLLMVKPISLQFIVSLRYINLGMPIPNLAAGIMMVSMGWSALGIPVTAYNLCLFALYLLSALTITYCLMIIPVILSFWFVNTGGARGHILCDLGMPTICLYRFIPG